MFDPPPGGAPLADDSQAAGVEELIGRSLVRWVRGVARRRHFVFAIAAILFLASLGVTVRDLGIQSDKSALFPDDLPFRVMETRYFDAFPQMHETIVIVLEGSGAEITRDAVRRLSEVLEADPENFLDVFVPSHPFFETHGLLYLEIEELEDIADRLATLQPMLAAVVRDPTLPGLIDPLRAALRALREGDAVDFDLVPILDRIGSTLEAAEVGDVGRLDWSEIVTWGDGTQNLLRQVIYVSPNLDYGSMAAAEGSIHALQEPARRLGIGNADSDVRMRMTGDMVLNFEEMQLLGSQVRAAGLASFVIVVILLLAALRSARLVMATVISLLVGLVCTAGFATLAIGHLNMISVAFAVLFIGLGVDFGIHLCMRFQELMRTGVSADSALLETTRGVGSSLVLCAVTTSVGFFAFVPTDFIGVAELGVIAGVGIFIGLAASFTIIPALLVRARSISNAPDAKRGPSSLSSWPTRHPRSVSSVALALALVAIFALPEIRFDKSPLGVRDPAADSVQVYEELLAEPGASPWSLNYLASDEAEARRFERSFESLPEVDEARTLWDYVPEAQEEKLEVIEEMALFADWEAIERTPSTATTASRRRSIEALRVEIEEDLDVGLGPEIEEVAARLRHRLVELEAELAALDPDAASARLLDLEDRLLARFDDPLRRLGRALRASTFRIDDLPGALRDRMLSKKGDVRIEILPAEDLNDEAALDRFVSAVRGVSPDVAGPPANIHDSAVAVVGALRQAFGAALLVIVVLLFVLWRRPMDVFFVVVPLVWAGLMTGLAMVALEIDFNFADVIVLPLLLGIGVDSGIHMVHRARIEGAKGAALLATSTARAVTFSALTTIASFGSLALVPHMGMASLGRLLVVGILATVVANLILLPALLGLAATRRRTSS
jgi:hopanoid biosynthesis associated RND transporter like protein HpnN